jgi:hypothetical protein
MRPTHADRSFPRPRRRAAVTLTALTLAGALAWPARARAQSVDAVLEAMPWVVYNIDGVPTVALSHRVWASAGNASIMVDRLYYVSNGFNCEQAVGGFLPLDAGTMVFYSNRTSTDQVAGFGASMKRAIGDHMMENELADSFRKLQGG